MTLPRNSSATIGHSGATAAVDIRCSPVRADDVPSRLATGAPRDRCPTAPQARRASIASIIGSGSRRPRPATATPAHRRGGHGRHAAEPIGATTRRCRRPRPRRARASAAEIAPRPLPPGPVARRHRARSRRCMNDDAVVAGCRPTSTYRSPRRVRARCLLGRQPIVTTVASSGSAAASTSGVGSSSISSASAQASCERITAQSAAGRRATTAARSRDVARRSAGRRRPGPDGRAADPDARTPSRARATRDRHPAPWRRSAVLDRVHVRRRYRVRGTVTSSRSCYHRSAWRRILRPISC